MAKYAGSKSVQKSDDFLQEVSRALAAVMEAKDPCLKEHSERVANLCANFCEQFNLFDEQKIKEIYFAALLHDIGLIGIPLDILKRSPNFTDHEKILVKRHPVSGEKILSYITCLEEILPIVRHHHEAFNGSGYPDGLRADEIPLGARILSLFNDYDVLVSPGFGRRALAMTDALEKISSGASGRYDKKLTIDVVRFIKATAGRPESYWLKKEAASMKALFTEILQKFKKGKLRPPVMPQVVRELQQAIRRTTSTHDKLAAIIEKEPVISLRLISVANSPVYRGVQQIRSVRAAIPRLGVKETLNVVMAIAHRGLYQTDRVRYKILMDKLWVHSLASAYGARLLARKLKFEDPDKHFLMGLVHDIGKILLLKAFTDAVQNKILDLEIIKDNIQEAHLGFGAALLKRWGFDKQFVNVITDHEGPAFSPETPREILVVNLANMITRNLDCSLFGGGVDFAELESAQLLAMDSDAIAAVSEEVATIIREVAHLF